MKIAVVTLTRGASELGNQLCDVIGGTLYCKSDYAGAFGAREIEKPFKTFAGKLFKQYDGLVFIMATGIVVRSLAPYIESKVSDPAVVVMDEGGQHAISLLSGHLGGGNALAMKVGQAVGASPVITTASDVTGNLAVDMLAKKLGAHIACMEDAKDVTAIGINGGCIDIYTSVLLPETLVSSLPDKVSVKAYDNTLTIEGLKERVFNDKACGRIIITSDLIEVPANSVQLIPRHFVAGIGCRRGTKASIIRAVFENACSKAGIDYRAVRSMATIGLKSDEEGILDLVKALQIPLDIIDLDDIKKVQAQFKGSDFVEKTIGVRAVAEPCAMLAGQAGYMKLKRHAEQGVTIAIWEEDYAIKG